MVIADIVQREYDSFSQFLEKKSGILLGNNKQYLVRSRLLPIARSKGFASLSELINKVLNGSDASLQQVVLDAMTTNETFWFRDTYAFDVLVKHIFPELVAKQSGIKIWCAACSSGQEPYSIAMNMLEYRNTAAKSFSGLQTIVATDISTEILAQAKKAEYDALSMSRGLSNERKQTFFEASGDGSFYRLKPEVKRLVSFKPINLLENVSHLGRFDVVFCRNVLIYFSPEVKKGILQQIAASLPPKGYLFVGASESITGLSDDFNLLRTQYGMVYQKKD